MAGSHHLFLPPCRSRSSCTTKACALPCAPIGNSLGDMPIRFAWFLLICGLHYWFSSLADVVLRDRGGGPAAGANCLEDCFTSWRVPLLPAGCSRAGSRSFRQCEVGNVEPRELDSILESCRTAAANAEEITRASQVQPCFRLHLVRQGTPRADITIFYAFCRLIDDIADSNRPVGRGEGRGSSAPGARPSAAPRRAGTCACARGATTQQIRNYSGDAGRDYRRRGDGPDYFPL